VRVRVVGGVQPRYNLFKKNRQIRDTRFDRENPKEVSDPSKVLYRAVLDVARSLGEFTSDDVRLKVGKSLPDKFVSRQMGCTLGRAKKAGKIRPTPRRIKSARKVCHGRPIRIWEALSSGRD